MKNLCKECLFMPCLCCLAIVALPCHCCTKNTFSVVIGNNNNNYSSKIFIFNLKTFSHFFI